MSSLNKVMLIGNLGKDPDTRFSPSGMAITTLSIATQEKAKDGERTEWHRVVTFQKLAETCQQHLTKGRKVYIEGRLQTQAYEKDGIKRYSTEIIANTVTFLSPARQQDQGYQNQGYPQQQQQSQGYPQQQQQPEKRFQYPDQQPQGYPSEGELPY